MPKLVWDNAGERFYETGIDHAALYVVDADGKYSNGVAWNGITSVSESPSGAEATALYADNIKYLNILSAEEFAATIEAYTFPDEFKLCNGESELGAGIIIGQQKRKTFGLSYRTRVGNDVEQEEYGYKLHMIYGCLAAPSEKAYSSINDSPEAITFSWSISTTPVNVTGHKPTALVTIDSTKVDADILATIEGILYGDNYETLTTQPTDWTTNYKNYYKKSGSLYIPISDTTAPSWSTGTYYSAANARLPLPDEIAAIVAAA